MRKQVQMRQVTPMLTVPDIAAAIDWYGKLGFALTGTDEATQGEGHVHWAHMRQGDVTIMFNKGETRPAPGSAIHFVTVDDADALWETARELATVTHEITTQFYGMRDFWIEDPWGHAFGFGHPVESAE